MRTVPSSLQSHLDGAELTVAFCWRIEPIGGNVEGYTNLDRDLVINGVTYSSSANMLPTSVAASLGVSKVDTVDVTALPDMNIGQLTTERLLTHYYEQARVSVFVVNYKGDLNDDTVLAAGVLGAPDYTIDPATQSVESVTFELVPWSEILNRKIGYQVKPTCQCPRFARSYCRNGEDVGGTGDGPDIADHTAAGTITVVTSRSKFRCTLGAPAGGTDWATFGIARFTDTDNPNYQPDNDYSGFPIKSFIAIGGGVYEIQLHTALPFLPTVGDSIDVEEGCDRTVTTCEAKGNVKNMFMAFPYVPGANNVNKKQKQ